MIRFIFDKPNAITVCGLMTTTIAVYCIIRGQYPGATALLMWAVMLDHCDGYLAKRARGRDADAAKIGADLDSLTDLISGAICPGLMAITLTGAAWYSLVATMMLNLGACLRISYFNNFGLAGSGRFRGVPMTYNVPMVGLCFLLDAVVGWPRMATSVPLGISVMAVMHVVPFGPRPLHGIGFLVVFLYAVLITVVAMCV
jgi:CDP-diacylglycerol--serine O-phosphatidyltransferase